MFHPISSLISSTTAKHLKGEVGTRMRAKPTGPDRQLYLDDGVA